MTELTSIAIPDFDNLVRAMNHNIGMLDSETIYLSELELQFRIFSATTIIGILAYILGVLL